jgi:hypothetical protein
MDSQIFNPNPTIFATTQPTASRRAAQASLSLWLLDEGDNSSDYDSDGEAEPIDADEIFGVIFSVSRLDFTNGALVEDLIRNQRSRAPFDVAGTARCRLCSLKSQ